MRYLGVLVITSLLLFSSCNKEEPFSTVDQFNLELEKIDEYLADKGITDAITHDSEIRYMINAEGNGISPLITDSIYVDYEGRFLDTDEVFDSNTNIAFYLGSVITGWQIMLPEMSEGDDYTLYIPSYYAYGNKARGSIPANSTLIFDIKLIKVTN